MPTIATNFLVNVMYLAFGLGALFFLAAITEKGFGFKLSDFLDHIEKAAKDGNTLPAALVVVAIIYLWASILPAFVHG